MSGNDDEKDDKTPSAEIIAWPGSPQTRPPAPRPTPEVPRDEAEALVVKALASITGREPDDIIREIRAREGVDATDDDGDDEATPENIIDLNAVREARHNQTAPNDGQAEMSALFRAGFRAVMDELTHLRPAGGELVIDAAFMREHGPRLLGSVFSSLGRAFLAKDAPEPHTAPSTAASTVEPTPAGAAAAETSESGEQPQPTQEAPVRPVEIRVDFGSLAVSLLSRLGVFGGRATASPAAAPPAPEAPPAAKSDEDPDGGPAGPTDG